MTALLLLVALGAAPHAPCEAPPVGMVCVPGGPAVLGADDKTEAEKPHRPPAAAAGTCAPARFRGLIVL